MLGMEIQDLMSVSLAFSLILVISLLSMFPFLRFEMGMLIMGHWTVEIYNFICLVFVCFTWTNFHLLDLSSPSVYEKKFSLNWIYHGWILGKLSNSGIQSTPPPNTGSSSEVLISSFMFEFLNKKLRSWKVHWLPVSHWPIDAPFPYVNVLVVMS